MKGSDRFLLAIVAGIVVLVLAAFVVVAVRPKPGYQPDDTPQGVVNNYIFALNQVDYAHAYTYLDPGLRGYPRDVDAFTHDIQQYGYFGTGDSVTLEVQDTQLTGQRATVTVLKTVFYQSGLLDSSQYSNSFQFRLALDEGAWHITDGDDYWVWCWNDRGGCD
jgi:hypothetical protein